MDWSGFTVHDAASIFIRYLSQLPESIIPPAFYEKFQAPLRSASNDESSVQTYKNLVLELPRLNSQLLLYILDILAVFAEKSEINKMSIRRLAIIFQPVVLSPVNDDEENIEDPTYRSLSQRVLEFLIANQDDFVVDAKLKR